MAFYHTINPVLLHLGPLEIRWYGVMYALSFLFVYWYIKKASREQKISLTETQIDSFLLWLTISMLFGARLFSVLFWDFTYYMQHPIQILAFWNGGLSFHGGFSGVLVASLFLCRKHKIPLLHFADVIIVPLALAQALGRIGNFINGELYGVPTTLPWAVNFGGEINATGNPVFRHPNQVYEAGYDLLIFITLWQLKGKKYQSGTLFALFLLLYSVFRTLTEFIREPEGMVGPLTISQALNIPLFILGITILWHNKKVQQSLS